MKIKPSPAMVYVYFLFGMIFVLQGCTPSIWNASDLVEWVREQAVQQGCDSGSIELEDWYRQTESGNVWYGECNNEAGESMTLAVNVDSVWTPSGE